MSLKSLILLTLLIGTSLTIFINPIQAGSSVLVEFLYYDKLCPYCPGQEIYYQVYLHNSMVVDNIERDYGNAVQVQRIYWMSPEGNKKINVYNLSLSDWNTIVVNEKVILKGGDQFVDEALLKQIINYYLALEHDVAISDVSLSARSILKGEILNVNVTVRNKGKQPESFNITVSLNSTVIEELYIELLEPGTDRAVSLYINTTEIDDGCYFLTVYSTPIKYEMNIHDNLYNAGIVEIKTRGVNSISVHDVAVLFVIPSKSWATNKEQINVTVFVKNFGLNAENFSLKIFLNESLINEVNVCLYPNSNSSEVFTIDLAGLTPGNYIIKAVAELEDAIRENNEFSSSVIVFGVSAGIDDLSFTGHIFLAFAFGFLETFSPCLLVLLSFLVSYTIGETAGFKESLTKILTFGTGFLSAALLTSTLAIFLSFVISSQKIMILVVCILALLFGLNAIGINTTWLFKRRQDAGTKTFVQKLAKGYAKTCAGMIIIGFLFYFLDPCIAPIFFAIIPLMINFNFTIVVVAFCLGVMLPFILIGALTGSLSILVRFSYKHRSKFRFISGLILTCYAVYLIFFYIL